MSRTVFVTLSFECDVEGDVPASVVGQNLCRLVPPMPQIGAPRWVATPTAVGFIRADEKKREAAA